MEKLYTVEVTGLVVFRATLADGRVVVGPIRGRGGNIGASYSHLPREEREVEALRRVEALQRVHARWPRRALPVFEPERGCVAMYPAFSCESDGEGVVVPLTGTRFSVPPWPAGYAAEPGDEERAREEVCRG